MSPTRLPDHAKVMHGEEGSVEANEHESEYDFTHFFVEYPARHLGQPEIEPGEKSEQCTANEYIVKVGNHEIGVLLLHVDGYRGMHDAREAPDHEHRDKAQSEKHGSGEPNFTSPHGTNPVEDFDPSGNCNQHG